MTEKLLNKFTSEEENKEESVFKSREKGQRRSVR